MSPDKVKEITREGLIHVLFCVKLYQHQIDEGRYFLHKHPWSAWSWRLPQVIKLMRSPGVYVGKGHMCQQGMWIEDREGKALAYQPTGWMTNSNYIISEMAIQCKNDGSQSDHRHADLKGGRAARAAVYPDKLCYSILKGLRRQLIKDNVLPLDGLGSVCEDAVEQEFQKSLVHGYFVDDVSGKRLDPNLVQTARKDEVDGVFKHKLFDKVPISECLRNTGAPPISTKWVDTNKSDTNDPDYRSRWVGREFKGHDGGRDDLFAATPPLEAKRSLIALASCQKNVDSDKIKKLGFIDIRKAYFHAKVKRLIYVKLPE